MTKGSRIAEGRTAEIFAWGDDQILKLFRPGFPSEFRDPAGIQLADLEAARARVIHAAGLTTPAVIDVVEVDGRSGILYERIFGPTMFQELTGGSPGAAVSLAPEKTVALARLLAELQADMHARTAPGLPELKPRLRWQIEHATPLPQEMKVAVLAHLDTLPDGNVICHGDLQPENVLMTADGPVIIDWPNATQGNPLADVACSPLLWLETGQVQLRRAPLDDSIMQQIEARLQQFLEAYLERYRELRPFEPSELEAWKLPVAAARLWGTPEQEDALLAIIQTTLTKESARRTSPQVER